MRLTREYSPPILRGKLGPEQMFGSLGYQVAPAFTASVSRSQAGRGAQARLVASALSGSPDAVGAVSRKPFADGVRPLAPGKQGLPQLSGKTDAERFAVIQAIERDI